MSEDGIAEKKPEASTADAERVTGDPKDASKSALQARIASRAGKDAQARLPSDHFVLQLGFGLENRDGQAFCRAILRPAMWGAGTRRVRTGIFATLVDIAGGHAPDGPRTPTLDLRVQILAEPPEEGPVELIARAWRVGRRFVVAETQLHDESGRIFGRGTTTFLNNAFPAGHSTRARIPEDPVPSFEALLDAREVDERSLELDSNLRLTNGLVGTVQGGVQSLLAELATEHLAGGPLATVDVDMRYLTTVRKGPLRAIARHVGQLGSLDTYRVDLVDVGSEDALVSTATLLSRPISD